MHRSIPPSSPISIHHVRLLRVGAMRARREPRAGQEARTRRIARSRRAIAPEDEPIGLEERGLEVDGDAADVEVGAEGVCVREIGRDDEAGRLGVDEGEVGVADRGGGLVGDLGRAGGAADAGGEGEGDVLLEPDEGGRDRGAQVCGRVDDDGDVGGVEGDGGAKGGSVGGDCGVALVRGVWKGKCRERAERSGPL